MVTPVNLLNSLVPKLEVYQVFRSLITTLDFSGINVFLDCVNNGLFLGGGEGVKEISGRIRKLRERSLQFPLPNRDLLPHTIFPHVSHNMFPLNFRNANCRAFKGRIGQDEGGVVASSFRQASQELVRSPQMWDTPVRLPPLPLGNMNHIQRAGACAELQPALTLFRFAWITKYWQRQGLKVGIHLPASSSDCTNDLTSKLFYFRDYLYWDYGFEDCLCIIIADYLMQNVYVVLEAGIRAQVSLC